MPLIIKTTEPAPTSQTVGLQVYNGLDCCLTLEVFEVIEPQLDEMTRPIYENAIRLQAPILAMECRGVLIDKAARGPVMELYQSQLTQIEASLAEILAEGLGIHNFNAGSWQQKAELFYVTLGLPRVRKRGKVTTDRSAMEKLRANFIAEPICSHILAIQDLRKKLGVLRTPLGRDGRIRTSYNIAGTDTGRLSSYASAFGDGTNLQNITGELRKIFVADPGYKLAYVDLEQAESRLVGAIVWNLFHDGKYLDFCESGDLHTSVCRMTWPTMAWTGDLAKDKALAKQKFYRDFDFRDAAKRLGHGTNYFGKPPQMAKETRIPVPLVTEFQHTYFSAFPGISEWHKWVRQKLIRDGWITSVMGRRRWFFGRRYDEATLRGAIAYDPQGSIADYLNTGMLEVWRHFNSGRLPGQLLLQVHDAIVFQYPEAQEHLVVPSVMKLLSYEIPLLHGRSLSIPTEAFVGWNWSYQKNSRKEIVNPDGLIPYDGNDSRKRSKPKAFLDRAFYPAD